MREIVFDTETTGFDPLSGDRLVEIGCVELINRIPTGETYHAYFNPQRDMPASAEAVHGLSARFLSDKPLFGSKAAELLEFLGDSMLVAHNARFDFGFLNAELERCGHPTVDMGRMIDSLTIARTLHPGAKHSLDALCSRYGIDRSHRIKHGALLDAELLAQLYIELTGGRQIGLTLMAEEQITVTVTTTQSMAIPAARPFRPARLFSPSAQELARHAAFLEKIDHPLWLDRPS
ncbi:MULTISPECIES: DNA polymerase III subunit epsilon [unclassified Sphingobium]|uniref:DNA polymerase III subunit epsilon n=1 Tax=unclassified Sphingobium TaxID=2611147 RepID=UPI0022249C8B|nr:MULTISPECIES: DNA polymerase III subunit epsilon [unclassified Sphingobium]MCW2396219.1 DNA polymerase-3 subunit epsilon [Sphingobium sp. B8D3B]MCW2419735.1 DNA polymerase-3 subunit epsilon [Sphingobium sp. B8D3C]